MDFLGNMHHLIMLMVIAHTGILVGKYEDLNLAVLHGYNLKFNGFLREYAPLDHVNGNSSYRYSGASRFIILYRRHSLWRLCLLTSVSHPSS